MTKIVLALLCALLPVSAGADTVMIAVGQDGMPPGGPKPEKFYLSALEDGIMDEFFMADNIVFNVGGYPPRSEKLATMRRAREGGAGFLLLVEALFAPAAPGTPPGETAPLPDRLAYSYLAVGDQRLIKSGDFSARQVEGADGLPAEDYYAALGRKVARLVLAGR